MSLHNFLSNYELDDLFLLESEKEFIENFQLENNLVTVQNLVALHNQSKLLFPSYFLRFGAFGIIEKQELEVLNVLLESGSAMAYEEMKSRYGKNLSKAPDEFLVIGAQRNGDLERDILSRNYEPIIERIIKRVDNKYWFKGQEFEDLIQEAFMGFLKAIEVYKIERRTKFKDFSHYVIQRHLGTIMNRSKNYRNRALNESFSYNMPVNNSNGNDTTFEELLEGATASPEKIVEDRTTYDEIFEMLTDNEQDVFEYYKDGYTYEEIAFELINEKKQINFDGMGYEKVSNSIKLYEAYISTIELLHKQIAKDASVPYITLIEDTLYATLQLRMDLKEVLEHLIAAVKNFNSEFQVSATEKWDKSTMKDLSEDVLLECLLSKQVIDLVEKLVNGNEESKEFQKASKKLKTVIEKELSNFIFEFAQRTVVFKHSHIAHKALTLDLQILKDMSLDEILDDIYDKFSFINSEGLGWKDIAHEMKRKKKSVDNTIQRIRNKGNQYVEEFEDLMKKEHLR